MTGRFQPHDVRQFLFLGRELNLASGVIQLHYALDGHRFTEQWRLPLRDIQSSPALEASLDMLFWLAGISYYKAACPPEIVFRERVPDRDTAHWLSHVYRHGLGEFAFVNQRPDIMQLRFPAADEDRLGSRRLGVAKRALLPIGGGKDSLLAGALLSEAGIDYEAVFVGRSPVIQQSAEVLGVPVKRLDRQLDPALFALNRQGALNGHVPITGIISAALVVFAVVADYSAIVMANESSAEEGNQRQVGGIEVNHQWSKSFEFESQFSAWVKAHVAKDLNYFSLLRPYSELAIMQAFAERSHLHGRFTSCNRNFAIQQLAEHAIWCCDCPKCRFVGLGLATQLSPEQVEQIMGGNLFADASQIEGVLALAGLNHDKPLECVGTVAESRAALQQLASRPAWRALPVVKAVTERLQQAQAITPGFAQLIAERGPCAIPEAFAKARL